MSPSETEKGGGGEGEAPDPTQEQVWPVEGRIRFLTLPDFTSARFFLFHTS